jgi:hypothetical protein
MATIRIPPFDVGKQLIEDEPPGPDGRTAIPNAPLVFPEQTEVDQFLAEELDTVVLNQLHPYLILVAKKSGTHINSLNEHISRGRDIIVTEDPALHLIWYYKTLYLKPLPQCLLNYDFWKEYLSKGRQEREYSVETLTVACRGALGLLRSYTLLIRHESDFLLAKKKHLIPKDIKFQQFQLFINAFKTVPDDAVARRYHYGQMRLSRLNFAVWLFPPHAWYYHRLDWQLGQYFTRWAPPLLFIWASTNLILSSMQVVHNSRGTDTWAAFHTASWIFATVILVVMAVMIVSLLVVIPIVYGSQLWFATGTFMVEFRKIKDAEREAVYASGTHDH